MGTLLISKCGRRAERLQRWGVLVTVHPAQRTAAEALAV